MIKILILALIISNPCLASSFEDDEGNYVEITDGKVAEGEEIEIYDPETDTYKNIEIESIEKSGNHLEIEAYDNEDNKVLKGSFEE